MKNLDESVGLDVYEDPAMAIPGDSMPLLIVELAGENIEPLSRTHDQPNNYRQIRIVSVDVSVLALSMKERDALSAKVEEDLIQYSNIGRYRELQNSVYGANADGAQRFWTASMTYNFQIHTLALDPYQIIRTG